MILIVVLICLLLTYFFDILASGVGSFGLYPVREGTAILDPTVWMLADIPLFVSLPSTG